MTLVIAEKLGKKLVVVSDTLISTTTIDGKSNCTHRFTSDSSAIKAIIINSNLCFSFAGNVKIAKQALKDILCNQNDKKRILDILYSYNQKNYQNINLDTEFIVYFGNPDYKLYIIKNGCKPLDAEKCYLGDQDAYKLYKKNYEIDFFSTRGDNVFKMSKIPETFSDLEIESYMKTQEGLLSVIESSIETVGGFVVTVIYENDKLNYMPYFISNKKLEDIAEPPVIDGWQLKYDIGKNEDGAYAENFICTNSDFFAIHMPLVNLGYIYEKDFINFMSPKKMCFDEIDFFDFLEKTKNIDRQYSLLLRHSEQNFTIKGNNVFNEKNVL